MKRSYKQRIGYRMQQVLDLVTREPGHSARWYAVRVCPDNHKSGAYAVRRAAKACLVRLMPGAVRGTYSVVVDKCALVTGRCECAGPLTQGPMGPMAASVPTSP